MIGFIVFYMFISGLVMIGEDLVTGDKNGDRNLVFAFLTGWIMLPIFIGILLGKIKK